MPTRRDILARSAIRTLFALALLSSLAACDTGLRPGSESLLDGISAQPPPSELAAMALDPYDANRRAVGTLGLANQSFAREPIYIKLFVDNSTDADPVVRASAIRGLAIHGSPDHVPILVKALKDPDTQVRLEAARGLQRLHSSVAVDALLFSMREPDSREIAGGESEPVVRAEAAGALAQYPEPRVLQSLIAGLDDSDLAVNRACLASLRTLTGQDFGLDRQAWLSWVKSTNTPFIAGSPYLYPVFTRTRRFYEYFPFVLPPPNEVQSTPTGLPRS